MSTGPLLSDNHHTETNQGVLLLKTHPFLTLHITEDSFWPKPNLWGLSPGEKVNCRSGGHAGSGETLPKVCED